MSNFERELVKSFNVFFNERGIDTAYRMKQHRFSQQMLDVLVDSSDRALYLGIECKSISPSKGVAGALLHSIFSVDKKGTVRLSLRCRNLLKDLAEIGYLAVELRMGSGKSKTAYFISWPEVWRRYSSGQAGFSTEEIRRTGDLRTGRHQLPGHFLIDLHLTQRCRILARQDIEIPSKTM